MANRQDNLCPSSPRGSRLSTSGTFKCHPAGLLESGCSTPNPPRAALILATSLFTSIPSNPSIAVFITYWLYSNALPQINMDSEDGELFIKVRLQLSSRAR